MPSSESEATIQNATPELALAAETPGVVRSRIDVSVGDVVAAHGVSYCCKVAAPELAASFLLVNLRDSL